MKISNYPEVEALHEDDLLVISRPGQGTKSVSIRALAQLLAAGVGNAVANNLNTTEEGYILDARQGKVIGDRFTYSTNEQVVGRWIDGKPLYRKVIGNGVTIPANGFVDLPLGISASILGRIVKVDIIAQTPSNVYNFALPIPYARDTSQELQIMAVFTDSPGYPAIRLLARSSNYSTHQVYAIIEYTKATD